MQVSRSWTNARRPRPRARIRPHRRWRGSYTCLSPVPEPHQGDAARAAESAPATTSAAVPESISGDVAPEEHDRPEGAVPGAAAAVPPPRLPPSRALTAALPPLSTAAAAASGQTQAGAVAAVSNGARPEAEPKSRVGARHDPPSDATNGSRANCAQETNGENT